MPILETVLGVGSVVSGVASTIFGAVGANKSNEDAKKAAKEQYKQAKELYDFDWESTQRKYEYAKATVDLQRRTSDNIYKYKTQLAVQNWEQQNQLREYEYKNAVERFNRSEQQFEDQIAINTISLGIAQNEATQAFNEAQIANNFQKESVERELLKALDTAAFAKADLRRERHNAIGTAANQRRRNELEYQIKSVDSAFKAQELAIQALLGEGQARARGTGRSAGKAVQSVLAAAGRQQAGIVQNMANAEQQFKIQASSIDHTMVNTINAVDIGIAKQNNNIDFARQEYNQSLRELQASMDSANSAFRSNMMKINRDKQAADMQAHYGRLLEPSIGPEIPKPIELPKSVFLDPLEPIKGPKPRKQAPQTASSFSTFANAAAGIGNTLGTIGEVGQMAGWFN